MAKAPSSEPNATTPSRESGPGPQPVASAERMAQATAAAPVMSERERYAINSRQAEADRRAAPAEKFYMGERGGVRADEVAVMNRALEAAGGTVEAREKIERTWQRGMDDRALAAALAGDAAPVIHAGNMPGMPSFDPNTMNTRPALATKETDEAAAKAAGAEQPPAERGQKSAA